MDKNSGNFRHGQLELAIITDRSLLVGIGDGHEWWQFSSMDNNSGWRRATVVQYCVPALYWLQVPSTCKTAEKYMPPEALCYQCLHLVCVASTRRGLGVGVGWAWAGRGL